MTETNDNNGTLRKIVFGTAGTLLGIWMVTVSTTIISLYAWRASLVVPPPDFKAKVDMIATTLVKVDSGFRKNHDALIRIETEQDHIKERIAEVRSEISDLKKKLI